MLKKEVKIMIICIIVTSYLAYYVGDVLFGPSSMKTLRLLKQEKKELITNIDNLKEQNAKLYKDYFELKSLYPSTP